MAGYQENRDNSQIVGQEVLVTVPQKMLLGESINYASGEPNASSIQDRMLAMVEAAARGLRTYGMLCPLLPGIADSQEDIGQIIKFAADCRAEEIFVEAVNPRGPGLRLCQEALEQNGCRAEAQAVGRIRHRADWSNYVAGLLLKVQGAMKEYSEISKLRFLLYPLGLRPEDRAKIERNDTGVVWLGSD